MKEQGVTTQADVDAAVAAILEYNGTITVLVREELVATVLGAMDIVVACEVFDGSYGAADKRLVTGQKALSIDLAPAYDGKRVAIYIVHKED